MDAFQQPAELLAHATLSIRRGEIGGQHSMRATLGYNSLSHIACGIIVEMGQIAYQGFTPIGSREGRSLAGRELQITMRTEVKQSIGLETVLHIEIGC